MRSATTYSMKKTMPVVLCALLLGACSGPKEVVYMEAYAPEESGLNLVKITDESSEIILGIVPKAFSYSGNLNATINTANGISIHNRYQWPTINLLDISPDGTQLAYCTGQNNSCNVMVRSTSAQGMATQRTFRNVSSFSWGHDNKLYFSDAKGGGYSHICSVSAKQGNLMSQLSQGSVNDRNPVASADGEKLFFTRMNSNGPSIWSLDRKDGTLTSCARGYNVCLIKDNPNAFICVRNSTNGRSEIWEVDYVSGKESLILSDEFRSFTNPRISPDGQWIACQGSTVSSIGQKKNLDVFVVRRDGTQLTQLTFHPAIDSNPVWATDGRSIFFLSCRANQRERYNIWRMNFNLND